MALTPKHIEIICEGLASGNSLRSICREMDMPQSTVRYALKSDPEAFAQTARARELGCDALADECIEIADDRTLEPNDRRVRIETRLKLLGKWSQRYSEKVDHTLSGPDGKPIEIAHANVADIAKQLGEAVAGQIEKVAPKALPASDGKDLL